MPSECEQDAIVHYNTHEHSAVCLMCHSLYVQCGFWGGVLIYLSLFVLQQGMNKSSFVNDITTAAHKSVQVVEWHESLISRKVIKVTSTHRGWAASFLISHVTQYMYLLNVSINIQSLWQCCTVTFSLWGKKVKVKMLILCLDSATMCLLY